MSFMLLEPHSGGAAMTATGTAGAAAAACPPLAVMLAVAMASSVVMAMDRLSAPALARAGPVTGSGLRTSCQVTISLIVACLLVRML